MAFSDIFFTKYVCLQHDGIGTNLHFFGFLQVHNCGYTIVGVAKKQISTKCRSSIQDEIRFPISGDRHINVPIMGSNPFCNLQDGNL